MSITLSRIYENITMKLGYFEREKWAWLNFTWNFACCVILGTIDDSVQLCWYLPYFFSCYSFQIFSLKKLHSEAIENNKQFRIDKINQKESNEDGVFKNFTTNVNMAFVIERIQPAPLFSFQKKRHLWMPPNVEHKQCV